MATIKEVAQLAGLSRTTVSRVINNHPYVSDEKRQQVLDAMKQLGYVPNSSAQRLRRNKTETIAVVISRIVNPFFSGLVDEMERVASEHGYQLILCNTRQSKEKELSYLELLRTKQVDGIIMASMQNEWEVIEPYTAYGPMVACNEYRPGMSIPLVRLNQEEAGYVATKHLLELGHRKIACLAGNKAIPLSEDRKAGYLRALQEYGIKAKEEWTYYHAFSIDDGKRWFRLFQTIETNTRPTAVFTGSDEVAAGILSEAKVHGWNIPKDLAIVGFDNQQIATLVTPRLTTIEQPISLIGRRALEVMFMLLDEQINDLPPFEERLPFRLIVRESTVLAINM
ncbi:LacI family DNA-binding transcriptional regulator [Halalkalibacterium halodurans]|uniref:LacI family DNA-binding transcriptional regulator n=2 Tax=Halalkalibacterium halodurans TaxID=86665 RepID=UPI0010FD8159|nr:LacI family DNA-binding transcriptional regulator [Halalkalibacterium halodurans]MED3647081.1 LacI family DNA-binding transcriptional regulator [Halalkalibacterium halodurans]